MKKVLPKSTVTFLFGILCLTFFSPASAQTIPSFTSSAPSGTVIYDRPFTYAFSATDGDSDPISFFVPGTQQNDAQYLSGYNTSTGSASVIWQSFTAVNTGLVVTAGAYMFYSSSGSGGTVTVSLYSGEGTGGTLLYTSTIHMPNAPNYQLFTVPVSSNVMITSGQKYTIAYSGSGFSGLFQSSPLNPYADGRSSYSANADIPFQVKIKPLITTPATTWLTLTDNGDGTGSLSGTPLAANAGAFSETLIAKAGTDYIQQAISFTISAPVATVSKIVAFAKNGGAELKWSKNNSVDFVKYYIYAGTTSNPTVIADSTSANEINDTTKMVTGLTNGTQYYFRVKAKDTNGFLSDYSPQDAAVPTEKAGNSLSFNGSNSRVTIPNSTVFDVSTLTMEAWVYASNFNQNGFIFEKGPVNTQYSMFFEGPSFCFRTVTNSGVIKSLYAGTSSDLGISNGNWYHIACTFNGTTKNIYVNGILKKSVNDPHILRTGQSGQTIGMYGTGGYYLNGKIDEVRIWNTVRTQSELNSNASAPLRGDEQGLVALYHLDEPAGSTAFDATSNANNGTWVNSPVAEASGAMSLGTPSGFYAISTSETAELHWSPSLGAAKYLIFSGSSSNPETVIDSTDATTITLSGLTNGTHYFYRVAGKSPDLTVSGYSNEDAVVPEDGEGNALSFDGDGDYVSIPNLSAMLSGKTALTISGWVYPRNPEGNSPDFDHFFGFRNDSDADFYVMQSHGTNLKAVIRTSSGAGEITATSTLIPNEWQHVAFTYDGSVIKLYHNGNEVGSSFASGTIEVGNLAFQMGFSNEGPFNYFLDGNVDEVQLWNKTQSQEEIVLNYTIPVRGDEPFLLGAWHLDEPTGVITYDATPNGNNGTLVGGTAFTSSTSFFQATLPVELSSFTGQISNGKVVLNWSTASEENNAGWEIQKQKLEDRSEMLEWETIGFVAGNGTTTEAQSYSFSSLVTSRSSGTGSPSSPAVYRLKQLDLDGTVSFSQILTIENKPTEFALQQNYPNPFNPVTVITYQLASKGNVELRVFDMLGREVKTLVNQVKEAGNYSVDFSAENLPSGVYFYRLNAGNFSETRKMTILK
ncbi:MAG: T9SS type A sorting domain-containing protein [Bacteroidetes bacterium]|nr:T9SS type A sorting domain-containing protein [Bacteroidota bacterium]